MKPMLMADILLCIHFIYILCVILPVPLILLGELFKWSFVRNSWFRNIHLGVIGIVIVQSLLSIPCPWTVWEHNLRVGAGSQGYEQTFISHWIGRLVFYDFEPWVFTMAYVIFGLLTLFLYVVFPPRWLSTLLKKK